MASHTIASAPAPPEIERTSRRRGAPWRALAAVEVLLAVTAVVVAVITDRFVPSLVLSALAGLSLLVRRERFSTLGFHRVRGAGRMTAQILGLTAAYGVVQLAVIMPVLNHVTGQRQNLSDFLDLEGNVGALIGLIALSWIYAAIFEEFAFRGYLQTRITDVLGDGAAGVLVAVILSSILFGLIHDQQGAIGIAITFLDALFFSYLRYRYDTVWAAVLAHGFNNTIGLIAFFLIGPIYGLW